MSFSNYDALIAEVLHGLEHCSLDPEHIQGCGDCPYIGKSCIERLCTDARNIILHMDKLLEQMENDKGGAL